MQKIKVIKNKHSGKDIIFYQMFCQKTNKNK